MVALVQLPLEKIRADRALQPRVSLCRTTAEEYAASLRAGEELPPLVVYFDRVVNWLASGFTRLEGHRIAGLKFAVCEVRTGGREEALIFAASCNAAHGLRRTEADRRRAVFMLVGTENEPGPARTWSAEKIARHCKAPVSFVQAMRADIEEDERRGERQRLLWADAGGGIATVRRVSSYRLEEKKDLTDTDREKIRAASVTQANKLLRLCDLLDLRAEDVLEECRRLTAKKCCG